MEGCEGRRWVEIGFTVLEPGQRTARLPEDTTRVPYEARVRGFVAGSCRLDDEVEVETLTGRRVRGRVVALEPRFAHDFGRPVPELIEAGLQARALLRLLDQGSAASSSDAIAQNAAAGGSTTEREVAAGDTAGGGAQA